MSDLTPLLREAADALWLIPMHAGLAQRLTHAAERTRPSEAEVDDILAIGEELVHTADFAAELPPFYAYGDNEAACRMSDDLERMRDAVREACERVRVILSTPPLPSAESVAGERTAEAAFLRAWEASGEANPWMFLRTYRTTPPAAAQDTGRGISESVRGDIQDATYDALMYFGAHDLHKPTDYLVAAQKVANDIAARAAGGE